jgi:hypothetical protein
MAEIKFLELVTRYSMLRLKVGVITLLRITKHLDFSARFGGEAEAECRHSF